MKTAAQFTVVLVTAPDLKVSRRLARLALEAHIVACASFVPQVESHYWWKQKIESSSEVLIIFKTSKSSLPALERLILENHPYDTPEIISLPLSSGTERYLQWLAANLRADQPGP